MRQWIVLCIVPILVCVAATHSSEESESNSSNKHSNNSNKKNICKAAQNFIEKYKVSLDPRKDTCQCGEIASVEVFDKSRKSIINYQRCNRCSDNRPAGVDSGFCSNNGNNNRFKNFVCPVRVIPCVGDLKVSVCCQGNAVTTPTQAPTEPPTTTPTQAPTEPPTTTTTQAATTTTLCVLDPDGFGCGDDGIIGWD